MRDNRTVPSASTLNTNGLIIHIVMRHIYRYLIMYQYINVWKLYLMYDDYKY